MCAYNAAYGIPACASPINNLVLRQQWGFNGWVISDCDAIEIINTSHNYTHSDPETAHAALVQGGTDVNCGPFYQAHLYDALQAGAVSQEDVDRAASRCRMTM